MLSSTTLKVTLVGTSLAIKGNGVRSVADVMRVILAIAGSANEDVVTNHLTVLAASVLPHSSVIGELIVISYCSSLYCSVTAVELPYVTPGVDGTVHWFIVPLQVLSSSTASIV